MKAYVRRIDTYLARLTARLPSSFVRPFHYLGYVAMPLAWFAYISLFTLIVLIPSNAAIAFSIACLLILPVASVIKFLFKRQRPDTLYAGSMIVKSYSFPSSHAYTAMVGGGYFLLQAASYHQWIPVVLSGIAVFIIGVSRVRLGAHYPSDVIAGWLLGALLLTSVYFALN